MTTTKLTVRDIRKEEFESLGQLMVDVYSGLDGFPTPDEQPDYYEMLMNIGDFSLRKNARVLVAQSVDDVLLGGVVYFGDMTEYGSGGIATSVRNASGIRLLGIHSRSRGMGAGKALTNACINIAKEKKHRQVILHTTHAMKLAWKMYEKLGFKRSVDLDFKQNEFPVFGFRLKLETVSSQT